MRPVYKRLTAAALTLIILSGMMLSRPYAVYAGANIIVTTQADEFTANGNCSLREAIVAANEYSWEDKCPPGIPGTTNSIYVPAGTYYLTIRGEKEQISRTGDLDITSSVSIYGAGIGKTKIDALTLGDRVFETINAGDVYIRDMEIKNGSASLPKDTAYDRGGAIFNTGKSIVHVFNVLFDGNKAGNTGGAMDNDEGAILYVNRSTIRGNTAGHGGGIYNLGWMWVSDSLILSNAAIASVESEYTASGGGIDNNTPDATMVLSNTTLAQNYAKEICTGKGGAGIFNDGYLQIMNATIVKNNGIGLILTESSSGSFQNTLIAGNTGVTGKAGTNCDPLFFNKPMKDYGYNLVDTTDCKFLGDATGDQIVAGWAAVKIAEAPANNGGPTMTYALLPGSPAIDGGITTNVLAADQRMYRRPADGNGDGKKVSDIGAFEYNAPPVRFYMPYLGK